MATNDKTTAFLIDTQGAELEVDTVNHVLSGVAIVSRGTVKHFRNWEADEVTLDQVVELGNQPNKGHRSRWTHSPESTGRHIGRVRNFRIDGDTVRGDLHIAKSAFNSPEGNFGQYLEDLAVEDPEAIGLSMSVDLSDEMFTESPGATPIRLAGIKTIDVVGEPALTDGLFNRNQFGALADRLNSLVDRQSGERSDVVSSMATSAGIEESTVNQILNGGIMCPPRERLAGFADVLGVSLSSLIRAAESDGCTYEGDDMSQEIEVKETETQTVAETASDGQTFIDAFGERGAVWFVQGKTMAECYGLHTWELAKDIAALRDENAELRQQLDAAKVASGEEEVSFTASSDTTEEDEATKTAKERAAALKRQGMTEGAAKVAAGFEKQYGKAGHG